MKKFNTVNGSAYQSFHLQQIDSDNIFVMHTKLIKLGDLDKNMFARNSMN